MCLLAGHCNLTLRMVYTSVPLITRRVLPGFAVVETSRHLLKFRVNLIVLIVYRCTCKEDAASVDDYTGSL